MLEIAVLSALVPVRGFAFALELSLSPVTVVILGKRFCKFGFDPGGNH